MSPTSKLRRNRPFRPLRRAIRMPVWADLATASGEVQLVERLAGSDEIGKPLDGRPSSGRGLRIHRGERTIGFWEPEVGRIEPGDVIVEIVPT